MKSESVELLLYYVDGEHKLIIFNVIETNVVEYNYVFQSNFVNQTAREVFKYRKTFFQHSIRYVRVNINYRRRSKSFALRAVAQTGRYIRLLDNSIGYDNNSVLSRLL